MVSTIWIAILFVNGDEKAILSLNLPSNDWKTSCNQAYKGPSNFFFKGQIDQIGSLPYVLISSVISSLNISSLTPFLMFAFNRFYPFILVSMFHSLVIVWSELHLLLPLHRKILVCLLYLHFLETVPFG